MSQMQSSFDVRSRFVILWTLAGTWFPVLISLASSWSVSGDNFEIVRAAAWLSAPIAALGQMFLLRGRVSTPWLWVAVSIATAILMELLFFFVMQPISGQLFEWQGSLLSIWLPYFLLQGALSGIAIGGPQTVAMMQWKLGAAWFLIVLGASLIAGAIGGVIWVTSGVAAAGGSGEMPWAGAMTTAIEQIAVGIITGVYLWQRLAQRSVDAAKRVP
jgi:hypothetical protein